MTTTTAALPTTFSAAKPATGTAASGSTSGGKDALSSLSGNFNNFLGLLMTQLQNQDPTAPLDTNQFTSQLVQFTSVQQQINTNASLTQLIQATQGSNLLQASSLVGQSVQLSGDQASLQNGSASVNFTSSSTQPVSIGVYGASGTLLNSATVTPAAGANSWTWNGKAANGARQADGAYKIVVQAADGTAVPFTTQGTVTGVQRSGTAINVQLGGLSVDLSTVASVAGQAGAAGGQATTN